MYSEILYYSRILCEKLKDEYKNYTMKSFQYNLNRSSEPNSVVASRDSNYWNECLNQIREGTYNYNFDVCIEEGRKYLKLVIVSYGNPSVHCFIDKTNGNVLKAASSSSPAKGIRYNLLNKDSRDNCFKYADWSGRYLYRK